MKLRTPPRNYWLLVAGMALVWLAGGFAWPFAVGLVLVIAVGVGTRIGWWLLTLFWGLALLVILLSVPFAIYSFVNVAWFAVLVILCIINLALLHSDSMRAHCRGMTLGRSPTSGPALS